MNDYTQELDEAAKILRLMKKGIEEYLKDLPGQGRRSLESSLESQKNKKSWLKKLFQHATEKGKDQAIDEYLEVAFKQDQKTHDLISKATQTLQHIAKCETLIEFFDNFTNQEEAWTEIKSTLRNAHYRYHRSAKPEIELETHNMLMRLEEKWEEQEAPTHDL